MQIEPKSFVPSPSRIPWLLSLFLLIFVIWSWVWLFFYNKAFESSIVNNKSEIDSVWQKISEIESDRQLVIRNILASNTIRPSIDVRGLVNEFREAASQANVRLQWFSVQEDTISTTLISTVWDASIHPDPAATIIKMMRTYSLGNKYFDLDPIMSISGDSARRTTWVQFHVSHESIKTN